VSGAVLGKPDCASGKSCRDQKDPGETPLFSVWDLTLTPNLTQITHESVRFHRSPLGDIILNNALPFSVNHMIDTATEKSAEPIVGPSHTLANTSGTVLDHREPQEIATN